MRQGQLSAAPLTDDPPQLALRHSATLTVLARMGFQGDVSDETFKSYIKGLRKLGVPFPLGVRGSGAWLAMYRYEHLMELAVALSLRTYNILPDSVVRQLIEARPALGPLYVEAWRRRARSPQSWVSFRGRNGSARVTPGPYLDLGLDPYGHRLGSTPAPRLITAAEALELYGAPTFPMFRPGPVPIAALARLMAEALATSDPDRTAPGARR